MTLPCETCSVMPCGGSPEDSGLCSAELCKAQGTAAEVKSEVEGDGQVAFLAASVAGGMSGRVLLMVFTGVGNDGSSAPSQSHFLAEDVGGTRMEVVVAWRNSANASLSILTQLLMVARVLQITRHKQHVGCSQKKRQHHC